jgi:hypothetical protein
MKILGELSGFDIAMLPLGVAHGVFLHIDQQQIFHWVASFVIQSNGNCSNRHLTAKILSSTIELYLPLSVSRTAIAQIDTLPQTFCVVL